MNRVERVVKASPEQVWAVLSDGWLYPLWVVGASRMREVDANWPEQGAQLHHSVGTWPVLIDDRTSVEASSPPSRLTLRARGWPAGDANVVLSLEPHPDGTTVSIEEDVRSGPASLVPKLVRAPLLRWRNVETLRRLAFVVERRQA